MASNKEIAREAKRRSLADDGKTSLDERFRIRNEIRAESGLPAEKHKRGFLAGAYDRNKSWVVPVLSGLAGLTGIGGAALPAILGGLKGFDRPGEGGIGFDAGKGLAGAATGYGAGKVGSAIGNLAGIGGGAAGAVPAAVPAPVAGAAPDLANVANASVTGVGGAVPAASGLSGILGRAKGLLTPENIFTGLQGLNAARGMARETDLTNEAVGLDRNRWRENAPLRDAGMEGLLNPQVADTSSLRQLSGQGNPFALPAPTNNVTPPVAAPPLDVVPAPQGALAPRTPAAFPVGRTAGRAPRFGGLR